MLQKVISIIFFLTVADILLLLSIVFRILKRGSEFIFYAAGFYVPVILILIVMGLIFFGKDYKTKNWLIVAINIVSIVIAFIYLQKALMVK